MWTGLNWLRVETRGGLKLYDDQLNAQVFKFILFIYLLLPYMFRAYF
jgi:hypothetical protein